MTLRVVVVAQESAGIQTVRLVAASGRRLNGVLTDPTCEPAPAAMLQELHVDVDLLPRTRLTA